MYVSLYVRVGVLHLWEEFEGKAKWKKWLLPLIPIVVIILISCKSESYSVGSAPLKFLSPTFTSISLLTLSLFWWKKLFWKVTEGEADSKVAEPITWRTWNIRIGQDQTLHSVECWCRQWLIEMMCSDWPVLLIRWVVASCTSWSFFRACDVILRYNK